MAIRIYREPESLTPLGSERCCFCRDITPCWHKPTDVAVCASCAKLFDPKDLPGKELWCEREYLIGQSVKLFGNPQVPCCFCRDLLPIPEQKSHAPICLRCRRIFPETQYPSWQQWAEKEEKIRKGVTLLSKQLTERPRKQSRPSPARRQTARA